MNFLNSIWRYTPDLSSLNNIISDNVFKENIIKIEHFDFRLEHSKDCLLYTSPSPRDGLLSRMPSSA